GRPGHQRCPLRPVHQPGPRGHRHAGHRRPARAVRRPRRPPRGCPGRGRPGRRAHGRGGHVTDELPPSDALVLFGATGDLAKKKIFPAVYEMARAGEHQVPVIGFASSDWDTERLRQHAREAVEAGGDVDEAVWDELAARICYVRGDYRDPASFDALRAALDERDAHHPLFYLAVPPELFDDVVVGLAAKDLNREARVVV